MQKNRNPQMKIPSLFKTLFVGASVDHTEEGRDLFAFTKRLIMIGLALVVGVVAFFGLWSSLAPLDSAAIAPGSVVLYSNRKTIQHLEGGIITELLVEEGDEVVSGQALVYLNNTSAKAKQDLLLGQWLYAKAAENRLEAERDEADTISFDAQLISAGIYNDIEVQKIIDSQNRLFVSKTKGLSGKVEILGQRVLQSGEEIEGLNAQKDAAQKQLKLSMAQLQKYQKLIKDGLVTETQTMETEQKVAELEGRLGEISASIAQAKEKIAETKLEIINVRNEYTKEVMTELKETQQEVADLEEQLLASKDVLERTVVTAPQSGRVTGLQYHTVGGVITPGTPIMDIVPQNDKLIIEARVMPQDIDIVRVGLQAKVVLSAYKTRFVPPVQGEVIQVSADSFSDEKTGESYYLARVEISEESLASLSSDVELYPGMPAEVFITTGESTLVQYLMSPITDSFRRAFKEE